MMPVRQGFLLILNEEKKTDFKTNIIIILEPAPHSCYVVPGRMDSLHFCRGLSAQQRFCPGKTHKDTMNES